jgi:hypothetical protein
MESFVKELLSAGLILIAMILFMLAAKIWHSPSSTYTRINESLKGKGDKEYEQTYIKKGLAIDIRSHSFIEKRCASDQAVDEILFN